MAVKAPGFFDNHRYRKYSLRHGVRHPQARGHPDAGLWQDRGGRDH